MQRLLWPLGLVVAFGLGLAAPGLWSDAQEVEHLKTATSRLQLQVSTLQARLHMSEAKLAAQQNATLATATASQVPPPRVEKRSEESGVAAAEGPARPRRARRGGPPQGEPQDDLASPARARRGAPTPAPTVEAALDRFYKYLDAVNGPGGPARWQQVREQTNDLRAMGDAGSKALMRVLADGTSSDDRRAAAQLLGQFQVPEALPLLQNILANDDDVLLRRAAASALRRLDMPDTIPAMQALLANPDEDRFVRMSAAYGLAQQGSPQGVIGLEQIFQEADADGRGRDMAFRALTSLNDQASLPFMRQLVTSNAEVSYRLRAIRFLAALGDGQALGPLQLVMQSPTEQPSIRDAAALAYAAIGGR